MKMPHRLLLSLVALTLFAVHPRLLGQSMPDFTVLHTFSGGAEGQSPSTGLVQGRDGNFYGVTSVGGSGSAGVVFKISPTGEYTVLHAFSTNDPTDGTNPNDELVQGTDGNFYGTTSLGGNHNAGTVYKMTPEGVFSIVYRVDPNRANGLHGLVQGRDGNFYSVTSGGPGTVFKVTPEGVFTLLHGFSAVSSQGTNSDGQSPYGALVEGSDGNFYGTTSRGGSNQSSTNTGLGCGTVFKITPDGELTTLHDFTGKDGQFPEGALALGNDGNLYGTTLAGGTTQSGGQTNGGAVFQITPAGVFTLLHTIGVTSGETGSFADAGVIQGSDGNLYGTTEQGITPGTRYGEVYQVTPDGVATTIHGFAEVGGGGMSTEGGYTIAPVVEGSDGNLYGTAEYGGANNLGTIFRVNTRLRGSVQFASSTVTAREADGTVSLQVTRGSSGVGITVQYATADGTALDGQDYTAASGTLTWEAGDTSPRTITVHLLNPGEEYPNARRRFTVNLSAPSSGTSLGANAVATVVLRGTTESPVITSPATANADATVPFTYQITATHGPRRFAVLGLPRGFSVDDKTGLISGTARAAGTHTLTLKAFNVGGEGDKTLTLTVTLRAPVITSAPTASGTVGRGFRYQIVASGNPGHYAVDGLLRGLTLESKTGLISGVPKGLGTHTLTLHAFNSQGEATQTLQLTLDKEAPVVTSPVTASGKVGAVFSYQITADGEPAQYRVMGLREGLHVDPDTGLITGTPTAAGRFKLTLEAVNSAGTGQATLTLTITN